MGDTLPSSIRAVSCGESPSYLAGYAKEDGLISSTPAAGDTSDEESDMHAGSGGGGDREPTSGVLALSLVSGEGMSVEALPSLGGLVDTGARGGSGDPEDILTGVVKERCMPCVRQRRPAKREGPPTLASASDMIGATAAWLVLQWFAMHSGGVRPESTARHAVHSQQVSALCTGDSVLGAGHVAWWW